MPLAPVTGVKLVAAWPDVNVVDATAWVAVTALSTVSEKVLDAVALVESVILTVKVVAAMGVVGLPVIVPVDVLIARPVGRAGEML